MKVTCNTCNLIFEKKNFSVRRSKNHFCSKECKYKKSDSCPLCLKNIDRNKEKRSKIFCNICYERNYYKENPERIELRKKKVRENLRRKRNLPLDTPRMRGENGSGSINGNGYKIIYNKNHPNSKNDRIAEHTLIMSNHIGRPLFKGENVHHINGDKLDNRIENLELWNKCQPCGQRIEDKIKFYIEFLNQYGYEVIKLSDHQVSRS